jgi:hypothetical protein
MKTKSIKINIFVFLYFILIANTAFAGLGVGPTQMSSSNLSAGSHIEETFVLSRSDPEEDLNFKVITEGLTKDWITLDRGMEFTMPAGKQRYLIIVKVDVPNNIITGDYNGGIRFVSSPTSLTEKVGSGSATVLSAFIQTDFSITNKQISEYNIPSIKIQDIKQKSPVNIELTIANTGNMVARPTKVHVDFFDKYNLKLLESHDITEIESVNPFATEDVVILVPTKLKNDQYWARVSVYKEETLLKEDSLVFEIIGNSDLLASAGLFGINLGIKGIISILLILALIIFVFLYKKRKFENANKKNL